MTFWIILNRTPPKSCAEKFARPNHTIQKNNVHGGLSNLSAGKSLSFPSEPGR